MPDPGLADYANVSRVVGAVVSSRLATLHELQTVYSVEDCFNLLEINAVNGHNHEIMAKRNADNN